MQQEIKKEKKLIIIPAYNESENIVTTVKNIQEFAEGFDYVVINDCSTDSTLEICREYGFNVISLPVNLGIGGAVQTGYKYAKKHRYDIAVQVDGDGQHDPKFLSMMYDTLKTKNLDMIIGSRFIDKEGFQSSLMRRIGIKYFQFLIQFLTKKKITDSTSGLRMVNRELIEYFANSYPEDYPEPETIVTLLLNGYRVEEVPVIMNERQGGVSSISPYKSIYYMIKVTLAILFVKLRRSN